MLFEWHWTTYILYVFVGIIFLHCIKYLHCNEKNAGLLLITRNSIKRWILILTAYLILLFLPMFRDIDIYPDYETAMEKEIQTIDPQAYIWQIKKGDNPGFHLKAMLTFSQTEPLFYTIAHFILKNGGDFNKVWFSIFSLITLCYIYFFYHTMDETINYLMLFPFISLFLYSMIGIRSGLSIAFFYAALANRQRGRGSAMIICLCVGFCFHYLIIFGAIGLLFEYLWNKVPDKKIFTVFGFLFMIMMTLLLKSKMYDLIINTKYRTYLDKSMTLIGQAPELVVFFLSLINYNKLEKKYPKRIWFVNLVVFNALCIPFIMIFNVYRLNMYFLIPRLYVWGMLIGIWIEKYKIGTAAVKVKIGRKKYCLYELCGGVTAFIWFTKQIYDMKGIGIMPLFNLYI